MNIIMKCGHTANGFKIVDGKEIPCCIICECTEPSEDQTMVKKLDGREAMCNYCGHKTQSKIDLPFFKYKLNEKYDEYYDGCFGWD
ncbi:MAG: hypothetical protein ABF536_04065 [Liquorilactobacillus mali]|uniref:hypothetical protein n=1 Tax=Liquorilactobacillus mali TaxID=1618 RepID=UPI0039E7A00B